ncbi:MAG: DNA repair protein RecO [Gammaproteobacteria bacterium]|nr:DNA repair protein RecO [Gammaproteobacteria bacterium]
MRRVAQQPAYILHNRAYRNTSLLIDALTRDYGRIGLVARGVRSSNAARRARLQAFRELRLSYTGGGELKNLSDVEEIAPAPSLHGEVLACGYYVNELLLRLTLKDDPHDGLFDTYRHALAGLSGGADIETTLRVFELRLLECLGYGLVLDRDDQGESLDPARYYQYVTDAAPVASSTPLPERGACRVRGACLIALREGRLPENCRAEAKQLLQTALQAHLGNKSLRSREFMADLRRLRDRGDGS